MPETPPGNSRSSPAIAFEPEAFERAMDRLRDEASAGSDWAQLRLADAEGAHGAILLALEGEGGGRTFVVVEHGTLSVTETLPAGVSVHIALAGPAEAARQGLQLLLVSGFDLTKVSTRLTGLASAKAARLFTSQPSTFAVHLKELPVVGELKVRVGLGMAEPPDAPSFTVATKYADLLSAREQKMAPPQMLIAGKLQILGDTTRAMQLGMLMMQLR